MKILKLKPAFEDERGSIWDLLSKEKIDHIGFLISKKNSVRGKHYHKKQKQYTLLLRGRMKVKAKNILEKNSKIEEFELNEMEMILFPPYYYHSLESLEDSECLVFTDKSRLGSGYDEDTFKIEDIEEFHNES